MTFADYTTAIAALEELLLHPPRARGEVGLRRVERLLRDLDDPQLAFPTLHITGSAGKGSTAAMAAAILHQAGHHTATFTSPHLVSYTERIAVDGLPITPATWAAYQSLIWPRVEAMVADSTAGYDLGRPIFLEVLWTMACLYFRDQGVACAVVEVGMGGQRDATTANAAKVGVITNVSLEHTAQLGPTIEAIATQKAGVIKPDMVVITAAAPPAQAVIAAAARHRGAILWRVAPSDRVLKGEDTAEVAYERDHDGSLTITTPLHQHHGLRPGLLGPHQAINAACAVGAVEAFSSRACLPVSREDIRRGLAAARVPGRLELLPGQPDILLDGAQTAAGVQALVVAIADLYPTRPLTLLVAIVSDKDLSSRIPAFTKMLEHAGSQGLMVVTEPPWAERGGTSTAIAALARSAGARVTVEPQYAPALQIARAATPSDGLLVVAGSLFLVGAVRALLDPATLPVPDQPQS